MSITTERVQRPRICRNITETIGNTPLVYLKRLGQNLPGRIVAKLESFNPMSSVKDRIGLALIEDAERTGLLRPGMTIVEPTGGNTGIALASVATVKGYQAIFVMPDHMSMERRRIMEAFGAELILTPYALGIPETIRVAEELVRRNPATHFMPQQFMNLANPEAHRGTTALEIWEDTEGQVDWFISAIGTGGTITGVASVLKAKKPTVKIVGVEPSESPVLSGGQFGPHRIEGIGAGFIPEVINVNLIDEIIQVSSEEAGAMARTLAREEGILCGTSSGAALVAALRIAELRQTSKQMIVVVLPDTGERYLSSWLFSQAD